MKTDKALRQNLKDNLMIPVTLLTSGSVMRASAKSYARQQELIGEMNGYVEETFGGLDIIV